MGIQFALRHAVHMATVKQIQVTVLHGGHSSQRVCVASGIQPSIWLLTKPRHHQSTSLWSVICPNISAIIFVWPVEQVHINIVFLVKSQQLTDLFIDFQEATSHEEKLLSLWAVNSLEMVRRDTPYDSDTGFSEKPASWGISFWNNEQLALTLIVDLLTVINNLNIVFCENFSWTVLFYIFALWPLTCKLAERKEIWCCFSVGGLIILWKPVRVSCFLQVERDVGVECADRCLVLPDTLRKLPWR